MLTFTHRSGGGSVELTFSDKPSAEIRGVLKGAGFRWSPSGGYWWRRGHEYADFVAALQTRIEREAGIRRPDGACWTCKAPEGFFRNRGAAAPVWCDKCAAEVAAKEAAEARALDVDRLYEDQCAATCGR